MSDISIPSTAGMAFCLINFIVKIWLLLTTLRRYDECMLTYSNQSILSVMRSNPALVMYNLANISDPTRFNNLLGDTLSDVLQRAATGLVPGKKFGVQKANFTVLQNLYTLAQCTPDLTTADCTTCLQMAVGSLPQGRQGARYFNPSCNVRYETYVFYNETNVALMFPPAPSPAPTEIPPVLVPVVKGNKDSYLLF